MKAVTFSYDDGVTQDRRLIALFNTYGLKATFNLNSGLLGVKGELPIGEVMVTHNKVEPEEVRELYAGHEVAAHTLTHPDLTALPEGDIVRQVEEDREALQRLTGREVVGMAYPGGGVNNDDRVAEVIRAKTGARYARTIVSTHTFDQQDNLYRFNPSVYHVEFDRLFELGERFLKLRPEEPKLFYIWGHSYELDYHDGWTRFEEFCRLISGHDDIFYGTNAQVLLDT